MADDPLLFTRLGRPIPETRMQVADVERLEPSGHDLGQFEGAGPLPQPEIFFLERTDATLGVGVVDMAFLMRGASSNAQPRE